MFAVEEPPPARAPSRGPRRRAGPSSARLGCAFWSVVAIGVPVHPGPVQRGLPVLRAQDAGLSIALVPVVLVR